MPQMAPMSWVTILLISLVSLALIISKIFFSIHTPTKHLTLTHVKFFSWQW